MENFGDACIKQAGADNRQTLDLCAVNGHHQNDVAKSSIGCFQSKARSIVLRVINF